METWKKIKLGSACRTNTDSYSPKEKWDFVNYLDTGNITNNTIDSIQFIDLAKQKLPSRAKRKVRTDSIVYSTVRPNQHHFGIIKSQPDNFLVSTGFAVLDVDADVLNADFLYYLLTQNTLVEGWSFLAYTGIWKIVIYGILCTFASRCIRKSDNCCYDGSY